MLLEYWRNRLPKILNKLEDKQLWNFLEFLRLNQIAWDYIEQSDKIRFISFLENESKNEQNLLKIFNILRSINILYLENTVAKKINSKVNDTLNEKIRDFGDSGSYDLAYENGKTKILPYVSYFNQINVENFVNAILNNKQNQIINAGYIEIIIKTVFDETNTMIEETKPYWNKLLLSIEKYRSYDIDLIKKINQINEII